MSAGWRFFSGQPGGAEIAFADDAQAWRVLGHFIGALHHAVLTAARTTALDFEQAHRVIALKQAEHLPLMQERFPGWAEKIEYWHIEDEPGVLPLLERRVIDLTTEMCR